MLCLNPWTGKRMEISNYCRQTYPCQHDVEIVHGTFGQTSHSMFATTIYDEMMSLFSNLDYRQDFARILNLSMDVSGIVYNYLFMIPEHFLYMFERNNNKIILEHAKNFNLDYFKFYSGFVTPRMFETLTESNIDPKFLFQFATLFNIPLSIDTARQALKYQQLEWLDYLVNEHEINPFESESTSGFFFEFGGQTLFVAGHAHEKSNQKTLDILCKQSEKWLSKICHGASTKRIEEYLGMYPIEFFTFSPDKIPRLTLAGKTFKRF